MLRKIILVLLPIFTLLVVSHSQEAQAKTSAELGPNNVWSFKEDDLGEKIYEKCGGGGGFSAWGSSTKKLGIDEQRAQASFIQCITSQMQKAGASPQAIAFTKQMNGEVYMGQFREMGKVDLATTVEPTLMDPNDEAFILVNGTPRIVSLWENVEKIDLTRDPLYQSLRQKYPDIMLWFHHGFVEMQNLAQGGQRFIFDFQLLNGCHACDIAGSVEIAFDFDAGGQFLGTKLVCLKGPSDSGACSAAPIQPRLHLTASALGKNSDENGVLALTVPMNVEVEVNLAAPKTDSLQYSWYKDGTFIGEGTLLKHKFSGSPESSTSLKGRDYEIKVTSVDRRFATSGSTSAVLSQVGTGLKIIVHEDENQACLGRLGMGCDNPNGVVEDELTSKAQIQQGCEKNDNNICITSEMSVGAIKHDKCCYGAKDMGKDAYRCAGENIIYGELKIPTPTDPTLPYKVVCEPEWEQAKSDKYHAWKAYNFSGTNAEFFYMWPPKPWVYRPGDKDPKNWWWHIAPAGAVVNQENPEADSVYCESGEVKSVEVTAGKLIWVCGKKVRDDLSKICTAPNAKSDKHLYVPGLSCRQLWDYYLYTRSSIPTFTNAQELISLAEKRALQVYEFVDKINIIGGAILSVASSKKVEEKIFNAMFESSGLLLILAPLGEEGGAEFARDLVNWMRDSLIASANYLSTGVASPPYTAAVSLANRFGTLWNIQFKVLAERNAIRLADEYLTSYYRNGSDAAKVALAYGLTNVSTTEDVMKKIAKQLGMGWLDYDLKKANQWVSSFKVAISNLANVCMQGSTCTDSQASPTALISEQKPIRETLNKQTAKLKTNKTTPTTNLKTKKAPRTGCNKSSSVLSPSTGRAEEALKKYDTGANGCAE